MRAAEAVKVERAGREELQRKWEDEERRREQERHQRRREERRATALNEQLLRWRQARDIVEYLSVLRTASSIQLPEDLEILSLQEWVDGATQYAARISPRIAVPHQTTHDTD